MKNSLLVLFLSFFFFLGNVTALSVDGLDLSGVTILDVYNCKTGVSVASISIPEKYFGKNGSLALPMEIELRQTEKTAVFTAQIIDLQVVLPANLTGAYELIVRGGDFISVQKVTL